MCRGAVGRTEGGRMAVFLKRGLLLFWAAWLTVVFTTNLLDGVKVVGLLGNDWAFASGNYRFLTQTTARYGTPAWLNGLLFAGVICWEAIAAVLFWSAWGRFSRRGTDRRTLPAMCVLVGVHGQAQLGEGPVGPVGRVAY